MVCEDKRYKLYHITLKNRQAGYFKNSKLAFKINFSNWLKKNEISMEDISNNISPLSLIGNCGDFVFKRISTQKGNIVRLQLSRSKIFKTPGIRFGFCYLDNKWPLNIN